MKPVGWKRYQGDRNRNSSVTGWASGNVFYLCHRNRHLTSYLQMQDISKGLEVDCKGSTKRYSHLLIPSHRERPLQRFYATDSLRCHHFRCPSIVQRTFLGTCGDCPWSLWRAHPRPSFESRTRTPDKGPDGSQSAGIGSHFGKYMDAPAITVEFPK